MSSRLVAVEVKKKGLRVETCSGSRTVAQGLYLAGLASFLFACCLMLCEAFGTLNVTGFCLQESSFA